MYYPQKRSINTWLDDKSRRKGVTQKNLDYLRELKETSRELGKAAVVNYFLLTRMGMQNCRTMMVSAAKQRKLVNCVCHDLKTYQVSAEYEPAFRQFVKALDTRAAYIMRIMQENLRLTAYWPFFNAVGFDRLLDFIPSWNSTTEHVLDTLLPEIEQWNAQHKEEIDAYMAEIQDELLAHQAYWKKVQAQEKAEKEAERVKKKAQKEYEDEILKNEKEYRKRQKRIEKSFECYWK